MIPEPAVLKFLGTAGARFVVARQLRSSGGIFLAAKGQKLIIDPGPGTLVRCAVSRPPIDPGKLTAVILTHSHIDHSNDVNILVDAMTFGGLQRRGKLCAPRECLEGENAVVFNYLRTFLEEIVILEETSDYALGELRFSTSVRHLHGAETYGLKFGLNGRVLSILVDTKFFPGLIQSYKDTDILVINVVRHAPFGDEEILHLSLEDAKEIIAAIKPEQTILTHFGMTMLKAKPWELAKSLTGELGLDVAAASDGMSIDLGVK